MELIDFDYLNKLSPTELQWLSDFAKEEIHANVDKNPRKNKFNKTRKGIKKIFNDNNARNRCTWTIEKGKGMAEYLEDHKDNLLTSNPEAFLATKMDLEKAGWVNRSGDVLITEDEVIQRYKNEEKARKIAARVKKK